MAMRDYKFTLQPGVERSLNVEGNWFHVGTATGAVEINFDEGAYILREQGQGGSRDYRRVSVRSSTAQTVTLALGHGQEFDARASVSANLAVTVEGANSGLAPQAFTLIPGQNFGVAANADRTEIAIKNPSRNAGSVWLAGVYFGDDNRGFELEPGESIILSSTSEIRFRNPSTATANIDISYAEFTKV